MSPHKLTCQCCKVESAVEVTGGNVGDHMKATGFAPVMNVRNGLEIMWVCPACVLELIPHVQAIMDKFGDQTRYLHFPNLMQTMEKKA